MYSLDALYVACNMTGASMSSSMNSSNQGGQECPYLQDFVWRKTYLSEHKYRNLVALICFDSLAIIVTVDFFPIFRAKRQEKTITLNVNTKPNHFKR